VAWREEPGKWRGRITVYEVGNVLFLMLFRCYDSRMRICCTYSAKCHENLIAQCFMISKTSLAILDWWWIGLSNTVWLAWRKTYAEISLFGVRSALNMDRVRLFSDETTVRPNM
jgi:hypothetical protein